VLHSGGRDKKRDEVDEEVLQEQRMAEDEEHRSVVGAEVLLVRKSDHIGQVGCRAKLATGDAQAYGPATIDKITEDEDEMEDFGCTDLADSLVVVASEGRHISSSAVAETGNREIRIFRGGPEGRTLCSPGVDAVGEVLGHFHKKFSVARTGSFRREPLGKYGEDSESHTGR
jgi:hypothetical protein